MLRFLKSVKPVRSSIDTCVDSDIAQLSQLVDHPIFSRHSQWADEMMDKIQSCKSGLRFLRMFFWSLLTLEDTDEITQILNHSVAKWEMSKKIELVDANLVLGNWIVDMQGRIQQCKPEFEESCELLLKHPSLRCKQKLTLKFLDAILENLRDLYKYKTDDDMVLLKNQLETLEKRLTLLQSLYNLTTKKWSGFEEMQEFKVAVHAFAQYSASLVFLYWVKEVDEDMATKLNLMLFNVLQKIRPCVPAFKAFYVRFLKEMKSGKLYSVLLAQIIQIFLDLLLENLVDISKDDFQFLQVSLMFVMLFLANPPDQLAEDKELMMITAEIEVLVEEDLYIVLSADDMDGEGNSSSANACLSDFTRKVELVKGKIRRVYDQIRDSFSYSLPKTNGLGFFDFLLQNLGFLKEKLKRDTSFIPFAKHLITKIEEELMSLRPYLNDLAEQQKEQKELRDTWLKVIDLAYQTEYAINSCSVIGHQLWYNMARLMEVLDEIKVVKSKLKEIEGRKTHDGGVLNRLAVALNKVPEDPWALGFDEVTVGLEKEIDIMVENLIRGSKFLDIVAIVGMGGQGKSTLANKVYNTSAVRQRFHVFAYCIVSQVHDARRILLDILGIIRGKDDKMYDMTEDDLAHMLYKCLKNRSYLIVMDDIWDVKAWDEIKRSLPNDQNGSRVIFTTRIQNVALEAKNNCILHHLRFLSDEESWDLLQKKALRAEGCPPNFLEVGKTIAKNCKGLPLTIVLIAGLLFRTERSLSWWNQISETVGSYVSNEGCMDVLELSYQHLPEHLKPCFLYFGAFVEDALIRVNKLTLLWMAEGFVQNSNMENLEKVAKEYLSDLVDRSLVIANERSSNGGIKSCRIHDLVHKFCQEKAQEENFFQLMDRYEVSDSSSSTPLNPYRACIQMKGRYLSNATKICPSIRSLLYSRKSGIYRHDRPDVSNLKLVQVMDLEELKWDAGFIKVIASLVHLRFIATSFLHERRSIVPSSISNLWNLEILILTVTGSRLCKLELPETIWIMKRLRHVDVGLCYLSYPGVKKHEAYPKLVNLESFSSPNISSTKDLEDLLQRSPSLQKLGFHYNYTIESDKISHSQRKASASKLEPVKDFRFPKLDSLSKLESLKVSSKSQLRLNPFKFPSNIKKLTLSGGFLPWTYLQTISTMPCLEALKLLDNAFVGLEWDMEDTGFVKLKFLKLQELDLGNWTASCESLPSLVVLVVNKCFELNEIPPCFGEMSTLKRIEVYESHKTSTSVVEIQEAQKDFGNEELQVIVADYMLRN